jgi:glycosidase
MNPFHRTARQLLWLACTLSATAPFTASAQTLARPGWVGSGMSTDLWWKHAVIYQVNPANFSPTDGSPLHGLTQRLDYIHSLGVDALLLTSIQPDPTHAQTINPTLGTLDDLDDLLREASSRQLRVLLELDPAIPAADLANVARFWLNRGIAGFHITGTSDAAHAQAATLRTTNSSYLGQRILIADTPTETASSVAPTATTTQTQPDSQPQANPTGRSRHHAHARSKSPSRPYTSLDSQSPQLLLDSRIGNITPLNAAAIRPVIDRLQDIQQAGHSLPLLATDGPAFQHSMSRYADGQHDLAIAKLLATLLFTTRAESLLYYGQELGVRTPSTPDATTPLITWDAPPPSAKSPSVPAETYIPSKAPDTSPNAALEDADPNSLLNWYRQLSGFHHGNATINSGTDITINRDDQNVLVLIRKPQTVSTLSPVLILLFNLTAQPVHLSLKADTTRLNLRGNFLRIVLRSDNGMGTLSLDSMTLAPYAVYLGELRY